NRRDQPLVRHRDKRTGDARLPQRGEQLDGARPPGYVLTNSRNDAVEEFLDDSLGRQSDAHVLTYVAAGVEEILPDKVQRVLRRPLAAVALGERELAGDPVGFGVDQRPIHVPEHRGGYASANGGRFRHVRSNFLITTAPSWIET